VEIKFVSCSNAYPQTPPSCTPNALDKLLKCEKHKALKKAQRGRVVRIFFKCLFHIVFGEGLKMPRRMRQCNRVEIFSPVILFVL
jgi:hypothetical protein